MKKIKQGKKKVNADRGIRAFGSFVLSPLSLMVMCNVQAAPDVKVSGTDYGASASLGWLYVVSPGNVDISDGGALTWRAGVTAGRWNDVKINVTGANSSMNALSYFILGSDRVGRNLSLNVTDGGAVSAAGISVGLHQYDKVEFNVSGANSIVSTPYSIDIGRNGDVTANISDGGTVQTVDLSIGIPTAVVPTKLNVSGGNLLAQTIVIGNSETDLNNDAVLRSDSIEFNSEKGIVKVGDGSSNARFDVKNVKFTSPGTVLFNNLSDVDVSSNFSGAGNIVKAGSSLLNLTGDNSNFSGTLDLQEGGASVHGVFGTQDAKIKVAKDSILSGDGLINGLVNVDAGGSLSFSGDILGSLKSDPYSDIKLSNEQLSELSVSDSVVVGGKYVVRVDPLSNNSDLLHSSNDVSLLPTSTLEVKKFRPGDYTPGSLYKVIQADAGLTGQFGVISGDIGSRYLTLRPLYESNSFSLVVDKLNSGFADDAITNNQRQLANSLYYDGNKQSQLWQNFAALNDAVKARNVLDKLSGDFYSSMWAAAIDESDIYRRTVNLRLIRASENQAIDNSSVGQNAAFSKLANWTPWIAPYGSHGNLDGSDEAGALNRSSNGVIFGIDGAINETWRLGVAAAAGKSRFSSSSRDASAKGEQYQFGAFASAKWDKLSFRGGLSQSISDLNSKRSISFDGFSDTSKASVDIITRQVFGEISYGLKYRSLDVSPFISAAYVDSDIDGFKEKGGDTRLNAQGIRKGVTFATVGSRLGKSFKIGDLNARVDGSLGYRQTLGSEYAKSNFSFADAQRGFKSEGVPLERNIAVTDFSFSVSPRKNIITGLSYQGKYGGGSYENSVVASVEMKF